MRERLGTFAIFAVLITCTVYCATEHRRLGADFPAQSAVNSSALCQSTYAVGLGVQPGRHAIGVQTQFDATPVWVAGSPNVTVAPGAAYSAFYPIDGGPQDAGYFNDGGAADAGPWYYSLTYTVSVGPTCYNDGGVDAGGYYGADGGYFYDAGSFTNDGGYCVVSDGGPADAGYFNDGGYALNYWAGNDAGCFVDGGVDDDGGYCLLYDGGVMADGGVSASYVSTYSPLIDAGLRDAGPGVVGEEISASTNADAFFRNLTVISQAPNALYCIKASGAQDGTRDGGWTSVTELP